MGRTLTEPYGMAQAVRDNVSYSVAMHKVFFEAYDWQPFIIALVASVVGPKKP